ncbi:MAG: GIY-YIG nuclease family protein, partial [Acidimicrobiales bacterium]|nr:GIY-YIG nuclease family protein [Acidimicrobiales bacterium]
MIVVSQSVDALIPERTQEQIRIYAWSTPDIPKYAGCLKVGQTTQDVNARIKQSHGQAKLDYTLEVDELAETESGAIFRDGDVRNRLKAKGFENVELEWMRCSAADVLTAIQELRTGQEFVGARHEDFPMRAEQEVAVEKAAAYYESIWAEDKDAVPRFLWNAKMRFGKTFATY